MVSLAMVECPRGTATRLTHGVLIVGVTMDGVHHVVLLRHGRWWWALGAESSCESKEWSWLDSGEDCRLYYLQQMVDQRRSEDRVENEG